MIKIDLGEFDFKLLEELVNEGKRVGKCPWCCSMNYESLASYILMQFYGIYGIESVEETEGRRKRESEKIQNNTD